MSSLAGLSLGWPEHRAATALGPTAAGEDLVRVRRIMAVAADLVVVGQFFTGPDGPDRFDEHAPVVDHRFAVWIAGMIDEARVIAMHTGIDDYPAVDDEQKRVIVTIALVLIAHVRLTVRNAIAQIFDDARAFADAAQGKYPASVHARAAHPHHARSGNDRRHDSLAAPGHGALKSRPALVLAPGPHTATGARIAGWN